MQSDIAEIKIDLKAVNEKVTAINDQTADLTEFRTDITIRLDNAAKDIKFIKHKITDNEQEIFDIKDHLKLVE